MSGTQIGNRDQKRNWRDACVYGGIQEGEPLFFRDTDLFFSSPSDGVLRMTADTKLELNAPAVKVYDADITVGAFEAGSVTDTINVVIQINQGDGVTAVAEAIVFDLFLSTDSAGLTLDAALAGGGVTAGSHGTIIKEHSTDVFLTCITEADGDFDLVMKDTAGATTYVQVVLPTGLKVASSRVKFT